MAVGGIAALTGGFGILMAGWKNVIGFITNIRRFFIIREELNNPRLARCGLRYLSLEFNQLIGEPFIYNVPVLYGKDKKKKYPVFRLLPYSATLRKGTKFIFYTTDDNETLTVTYPRWMFVSGFFVKKAHELMVVEIEEESNKEAISIHNLNVNMVTGTRFSVASLDGPSGRGGRDEADEAPGYKNSGRNQLKTPQSGTYLNGIWFYERHDEFVKCGDCLNGKRDDYMVDFRSGATDVYFLSQEQETFVQEFSRWLSLGNWYRERSIPWKRGLCISGIPGSGKTSFVRYLGMKFNMPIFVMDLSSMTNEDLKNKWNNYIACNAPCIVLFEDLDSIYEGRANITNIQGVKPGVSFDCFLNVIDGVQANDGIYTIITTNRPEVLDEAIAKHDIGQGGKYIPTRPGRIDSVMHIGHASEDIKNKIAAKILDKWPTEIPSVLTEGPTDTSAQMQERCIRRAIQLIEKEFTK